MVAQLHFAASQRSFSFSPSQPIPGPLDMSNTLQPNVCSLDAAESGKALARVVTEANMRL
jgi:hypothetical protein